MRRLLLAASVALLGLVLSVAGCIAAKDAGGGTAATTAAISTADLQQRLRLIADDSMMGRESGGKGDDEAAAYVASEFRRLGLEPAGKNGTYFQTVPLWRLTPDSTSVLVVGADTLRLGRDFATYGSFPQQTLANTRAVLGGSGMDSAHWIGRREAAGRIVVLDLPAGLPRSDPQPLVQRWRDATVVAITGLEKFPPALVAQFLRGGMLIPDSSLDPHALRLLIITRRAAGILLGGSPGELTPGTPGRAVSGRFGFRVTPVAYPARNVIGILRGSDPALRGEYVALSAHHDHVGFDHSPVDHDSLRAYDRVVRPQGADSPPRQPTAEESARVHAILDSLRALRPPRADSIRNGADDDGSGTVSLLEIAEAMARGPVRPRRSILFISHTGEEAGLLGSAWFTDHPTVPLDSIVGEIDQDGVGRGERTDRPIHGTGAGGPTYLEEMGATRLSKAFGATLDSVNGRQPVPFVFYRGYDQPGDPYNYFCRNDAYNYARYGIPTVSLSRGEHLDYHEVTDEEQYIDYPDLARVTTLVRDVAMVLANAPARPKLDHPKPKDPHAPCRQ
ncbi:MAG TPA: M28 family peptidase [Gemmatimonadales bacterium]|nr:M28 family peptidase [Gemmatimonadales bacterium]